jgi:nucleoid DNA-binding protein
MNIPTSICRQILWQYVNLKIKRAIHHAHVFSVISILFDEIVKDFIAGKELKIVNFGTIELKEMKPRNYHNVKLMRVVKSEGHKILRFTLAPKVKKKLCKLLDLDKTFKDD